MHIFARGLRCESGRQAAALHAAADGWDYGNGGSGCRDAVWFSLQEIWSDSPILVLLSAALRRREVRPPGRFSRPPRSFFQVFPSSIDCIPHRVAFHSASRVVRMAAFQLSADGVGLCCVYRGRLRIDVRSTGFANIRICVRKTYFYEAVASRR